MECLDELTVVAMCEGGLEGEALEAAEAHVDGCDACRELLAAVARSDDLRPVAAGFAPGEVVGRHLILHKVGEGGMGTIYAAWDTSLDRRVALKVVAEARAADAGAQERLTREAKAMASIRHRNVVGIYEVGQLDGRIYIAMEYMEGGTLAQQLLRSPRPPWRELLQCLLDAGEGLAAAHRVGLIHRDFKPANILLAEGRVCVTDFGLARAPAPSEPAAEAGTGGVLTRPAGTPEYMAPEQRAGEPVTARADQYSFCATVWEALYGERPAQRGASVEAREVPTMIRRVLQRGLDERPEDRHPDMPTLLAALRRAAASPSRWRYGAAAVAATSLVGAAWVVGTNDPAGCSDGLESWASRWNAPAQAELRGGFEATGADYAGPTFEHFARQFDAYVDRWAHAHREACTEGSTARLQCLARHRDQAFDLLDALGQPDRRALQSAVIEAMHLPRVSDCGRADEREEVAALLAELDAIHRRRLFGRLDDVESDLDAVEERAQALGSDAVRARVAIERSHSAQAHAHSGAAIPLLVEAGELAVRADRPEIAARAFAKLSVLETAGRRPEWAEHWGRMADAMLGRLGEVTEVHAIVAANHGDARLLAGDLVAARSNYERAVEIGTETQGPDHPDVLDARKQLAGILRYSGALEPALAILRDVLARQTALLGETHLDVAATLDELGNTLSNLDRSEEAIELQRKALALRLRILGEKHALVGASKGNLGTTLNNMGKPAEALPVLQEARALVEELEGPQHVNALVLRTQIGNALYRLDRFAEARDTWLAVAADFDDQADTPEIMDVLHVYIAQAMIELEDYEAARAQLVIAVEKTEAAYPQGAPQRLMPAIELANVSRLAGEPDPAALERLLAALGPEAQSEYAARARFYLAESIVDAGGDRARAVAVAISAQAIALGTDPELGQFISEWIAAND